MSLHPLQKLCVDEAICNSPKVEFIDLPWELRDIIYEYSLIRPNIFVRGPLTARHKDDLYTKDLKERTHLGIIHLDPKRPTSKYQHFYNYLRNPICVGLLRGVCKQVQAEAEEMFYSIENKLVFPPRGSQLPWMNNFAKTPPFKQLSMAFDARDIHSSAGIHYGADRIVEKTLSSDEHFWRDPQPRRHQRDVDEYDVHKHDCYEMDLVRCWSRRFEWLEATPHLEFVKLNFDLTFCPQGCCRLTRALHPILPRFKRIPKVLVLIGFSDRAEGLSLIRALLIRNKMTFEKISEIYDACLAPDQSNETDLKGFCRYHSKGRWLEVWLADLENLIS